MVVEKFFGVVLQWGESGGSESFVAAVADGTQFQVHCRHRRVASHGATPPPVAVRGLHSSLFQVVSCADALCTVLGGVVDDFLDWVFLGGEMPIGISGDAQLYTGFDGLGKGGGGASSKRQ